MITLSRINLKVEKQRKPLDAEHFSRVRFKVLHVLITVLITMHLNTLLYTIIIILHSFLTTSDTIVYAHAISLTIFFYDTASESLILL